MKKFYTQKTYEIKFSTNFLPNISITVHMIQSTSDLVTVNLVTNFDLVTFFWKTNFLFSKNSRFSDILREY